MLHESLPHAGGHGDMPPPLPMFRPHGFRGESRMSASIRTVQHAARSHGGDKTLGIPFPLRLTFASEFPPSA